MASTATRPRVFLDISIGSESAGRIVIELFSDHAPKTCENFRVLCTGSKPDLTYKLTRFHRIIDEFMIQGGDITKGNGTGGVSIYGPEFEDENIGWRGIDAPGLVCMANRGKDTNNSQFFITLDACEHLNAKHTVFGHVVSGQGTLERMAKVDVDKQDVPLLDVVISHSGELERRKKAASQQLLKVPDSSDTRASSTSRGRHKRRHSSSPSRSRSRSPSRGHTRASASRHRHRHRRHRRAQSVSSSSPTPPVAARHRSDASEDHTLRGRPRNRTRSRTQSPTPDHSNASPPRQHQRKRSPPPSRPRSLSGSAGNRRQRSLPNQYRQRERGQRDRPAWDRDEELRREEWERDGGDRRYEDTSGRLGGGGAYDEWGGEGENSNGIVYKGRGAMKYRETKRW